MTRGWSFGPSDVKRPPLNACPDGGSVDLASLNRLELKLDTADSKFLNSPWPTSYCLGCVTLGAHASFY